MTTATATSIQRATLEAALAAKFAPEVSGDNVWSVLNSICDPSKTNMIRFDYAGAAIAKGDSAKRAASGETKDSETVFHANTFAVKTAGKANNVYLYTNRAMRTEAADGSFDHRSYRVASPDEISIPVILVNDNFEKGWNPVDISSMSVFPIIESEDDLNRLGELLHLRADVENLKNHIDKAKKNSMSRAAKKLKAGEVARNENGSVRWIAPSGTSSKIVDEDGNAISKTSFTRTDGMKLVPETGSVKFSPLPDLPRDFNDLPTLHALAKQASEALSALNALIRPYELGLCEHASSDLVVLNGEIFSIVSFEYRDSDYSPAASALLKAGKYRTEQVPKSRGSNEFEEAKA